MPFSLINAPAIFQYLMNNIFRKSLDDFVVYYLANILLFSKNKKDHEKHVQMVLQKLHNAELYAKLEKCIFHQPQVEFLDYTISRKDHSMDPKKIQTIIEWKKPKSIQVVHCFLGIAKFYQLFMRRKLNVQVIYPHRFFLRCYSP